MKSIIFSIILILSVVSVNADGILDFQYSLEVGYLPPFGNYDFMKESFATDLRARLLIMDFLFIGGGTKTYFQIPEDLNCHPFESDYLFDFGFFFGDKDSWYLEVGLRHWCYHPVVNASGSISTGDVPTAFTEIYIRVEGKVNLF